jgi:hypothetical protein
VIRAAQQLGRRAKGVPKTLSPAALAQRRENCAAINAARKAAAQRKHQKSNQHPRWHHELEAKNRATREVDNQN